MRTIHTSFEKQRLKYLQWARRVHAVVGRERFRRVAVAVSLGVSINHFEAITARMREEDMIESFGKNHSMRWRLTRKICEEITG